MLYFGEYVTVQTVSKLEAFFAVFREKTEFNSVDTLAIQVC